MSDATRRLADELTDDELDTLVEMVQARNEGRLTRREVVKSGGILAALGLGGGAAVGSASADASTSDSDGNVGRPSDRIDGFFDGVDATSVNTGKGQGAIRLTSDSSISVNVPNDYSTIQDAVDDLVTLTTAYNISINVDDGTYLEDVMVPPIIGRFNTDSSLATELPNGELSINGNTTTPSNVKVNSFTIVNPSGPSGVTINGFEIQSQSPYVDEPSGTWSGGQGETTFNNIQWDSTYSGVGVFAYAGRVVAKNCDVTNTDFGFVAKREGHISFSSVSGSPNTNLSKAQGGGVVMGDSLGSGGAKSGSVEANGGLIVDPGNSDIYTRGATVGDKTNVFVEKTANQSLTSDGSQDAIAWDNQQNDIRGEFDMSTYEFSPSTPGRYEFNVTSRFDNLSNRSAIIYRLDKNGNQHRLQSRDAIEFESRHWSVKVEMDTTDTATLTVETADEDCRLKGNSDVSYMSIDKV